MKGGPTDPPNRAGGAAQSPGQRASMKGGPTDPPNLSPWRLDQQYWLSFNEGGAY